MRRLRCMAVTDNGVPHFAWRAATSDAGRPNRNGSIGATTDLTQMRQDAEAVPEWGPDETLTPAGILP